MSSAPGGPNRSVRNLGVVTSESNTRTTVRPGDQTDRLGISGPLGYRPGDQTDRLGISGRVRSWTERVSFVARGTKPIG